VSTPPPAAIAPQAKVRHPPHPRMRRLPPGRARGGPSRDVQEHKPPTRAGARPEGRARGCLSEEPIGAAHSLTNAAAPKEALICRPAADSSTPRNQKFLLGTESGQRRVRTGAAPGPRRAASRSPEEGCPRADGRAERSRERLSVRLTPDIVPANLVAAHGSASCGDRDPRLWLSDASAYG